ncbi:MAG TPA: hypothetical protein PKA06_12785 [Gemmatales bacterium]|nr:hypothetical protein [Gemmatales bacterium]
MTTAADVKAVLEAGEGIVRLAPTWVPRSFLTPGRRLKLHPADIYALGAHRGGIDERWFSSTTPAANEGAPSRTTCTRMMSKLLLSASKASRSRTTSHHR